MMGTPSSIRWMAGAAALALAPFMANAQVRQPPADVAGGAPAPTATPIKITPRDVINTVDTLINPKPKPTATPTGQPTATPTASPTQTPDPRPTATATQTPRPTPTAGPIAPPSAVATVAPTAEPLATAASEPLPTDEAAPNPLETAVAEVVPLLPREEPSGYLGWIAALIALLAAGGFALKQWLRPKLSLSCEIETGASNLTAASSPALTAPDLAFTVRIEPGEASAPIGRPILSTGDPA